MAILNEGTPDNASVTSEVDSDGNAVIAVPPDSTVDLNETDSSGVADEYLDEEIETRDSDEFPVRELSDRTEEIPALLGRNNISDDEESENAPDQDETAENVEKEDGSAASAPDSLPDNQLLQEMMAVSERSSMEPPAMWGEVTKMLESMQESLHDSLAQTQYISAKLDAVSSETEGLITQVNSVSLNCELLAAELESISSGANNKSMLSKTYLIISSVVLALLVVFQLYIFTLQNSTQRIQGNASSAVLQNISSLNKKMVVYDKNISKILEKSAEEEHAKANPVTADKTGHEAHGASEAGHVNVTPVLEKLNKVRNGFPEKKLIRKETGDWFVYNKKNDECISDVDVIEALNQAYRKTGRSITTSIPLPAHKALCVLKPDGKGGTQVVMTKEFLP